MAAKMELGGLFKKREKKAGSWGGVGCKVREKIGEE